jgi:CheY-like chemotaxis protein
MASFRIAVVDDNSMFVQMATEKLEQELGRSDVIGDLTIDGFEDPVEFVYQFKLNRYNLVFLDQNMPALSGTEVLKNLHEISKETFFVFVTDFEDDEHLIRSTDLPMVLGIYPKSKHLFYNLIRIIPFIYKYDQNRKRSSLEQQILYGLLVVLVVLLILLVLMLS